MTAGLRVCHVITGLETGGAERMLARLIEWRASPAHDRVVVLRNAGPTAAQIEAAGATVDVVGMTGMIPLPAHWRRLRRAVRGFRPDVVLGWMYHGNMAASLVADAPVVWSIRQSFGGFDRERRATRWVIRAGARRSTHPARIIYNSRSSLEQHRLLGFDGTRAVVIPNGFDLSRFVHDPAARSSLQALGVPAGSFVVGNAARWHPMKNHLGLIAAFEMAHAQRPEMHLVMAGKHVDAENESIANATAGLRRCGAVTLLGERDDLHQLMAGFDCYCSASLWGEGFPNSVGEAMACGVPCVVTDIGDSAVVVGDTGMVLPATDAASIAGALLHCASQPRDVLMDLGTAARRRMIDNFDIAVIGRRYYDVLNQVAANPEVARAH